MIEELIAAKDIMSHPSDIAYVNIENENFYKISNSDAMRPFFMSIVSDSNHWMFISSNGGLTAGRKNSEYALFPYYTDDKITESAETTGSKSIFRVAKNHEIHVWEPFSERFEGFYDVTRNLYKNAYGNKVLFEEVNHDLELTFRYQWNSSDAFGFVRKSALINNADDSVQIELIDGIQNILPFGVGSDLQNASSNLVDAYKRNELQENTGLGIYALSAIIVDKAEPSEALKANIAWSLGFEKPTYLLSSQQLRAFRKKQPLHQETDVKAEKGAYFMNATISLSAKATKEWMLVANVNQNHSDIAHISEKINNENELYQRVKEDVELGTKNLIELNASSDALQLTADTFRDTRHFSNTLFNIMRGGIFDDNYNIEKWDFEKYLSKANKKVARTTEAIVEELPETFNLSTLHSLGNQSNDKNFRRLCLEYMPLKFSRRHGDPSRPWNKFSINTRNEVDGSKILDYEGNWRDIFQNWEALAHSYPEFIESMIHKFLNATTFDGYNPYRVTKDGFDWEAIEPDDPWSYIGYWGDHQIIYLLKFLEFARNHYPQKLASFFDKDLFVYANVPYKIKSYAAILKNPKDTIEFDTASDTNIRQKREELGADGALLRDENMFIHKVNFIEKMLATVLAKISNFIPEGGIWMNTQRPEWNDANNALVGNGVSMVTLCYLRRFIKFFLETVSEASMKETTISEELLVFFKSIVNTFDSYEKLLFDNISDVDKKNILDGLGQAGSDFRTTIYEKAFTGRKATITAAELKHFLSITLKYLDHTIDANKRDDDLYHAYNLMTLHNNAISISYLDEMLEGQVAVLSSGYISSVDSLKLLDGLKKSQLFREDQYSYLLYPNKELSLFSEKNRIPNEAVENSELFTKLLNDGNKQVIDRDVNGKYHFNGNFNNAASLQDALDTLDEALYGKLVEAERELLLGTFEAVFNHKEFTGRSGTFYGYEGLGSIYWHMVSKLQLAIQECCLKAIENKENDEVVGRLLAHYYEVNEGIGVHKPPSLYGAFPTDPYSHTPAGKGAQQPGMTGQVKEDILSRFGELGVFVNEGKLYFNPCLLRKDEFLKEPTTFNYVSISKEQKAMLLQEDSLCFTYCQIPVIFTMADEETLKVTFRDKSTKTFENLRLDINTSEHIFSRSGEVLQIDVNIKKSDLK